MLSIHNLQNIYYLTVWTQIGGIIGIKNVLSHVKCYIAMYMDYTLYFTVINVKLWQDSKVRVHVPTCVLDDIIVVGITSFASRKIGHILKGINHSTY